MPLFLVTVKLPKNPTHDPRNKVTTTCPAAALIDDNWACTDATGEHHTVPVFKNDSNSAAELFSAQGIHVTRVEGPFA
jgi:hypothetical protein